MTEERLEVWVSNLFAAFSFPTACTAGLFGAAVLMLGLVISAGTGLIHVYVSTRLFWFASVGVGWVAGWLAWGANAYPKLLSSICDVLDVDRSTADCVARVKRRMSSNLAHLLFASLLTIGGLVLLYFVIRGFEIHPQAIAILGVPKVLPEVFYDGQKLFPKLVLLLFPLFVGSLVVVTAIDLFRGDLAIMRRLSQRRLAVPYLLSLPRLDDIGSFHAKTATSWFGGVAIVILALESQFTPLAIAIVVLLSSIGLVIFVVPQYYWHLKLAREKQELLEALTLSLNQVGTFSKPYAANAAWLDQLCTQIETCSTVANLRTWPFEIQNVLQVILTFAVPIVSVILRFSP